MAWLRKQRRAQRWALAAAAAAKQEPHWPVGRVRQGAGRAQPRVLEPRGEGLTRLEALWLAVLLLLAGLALGELAREG